jgi:hypothetical protein
MFNIKLKPANYLYNVLALALLFSIIGVPLALITPLAFIVGLVSGTVLGFVQKSFSHFSIMMAVQKEIWEADIEEEIFKDNSFLRFSFKADEYVNGRAVHIPQSGGSGNVSKNRTNLPANVRKRTDTDVIYLIDEYTTDPVLIPNADTVELTYDKRASVLGEDKQKLVQTVAEEALYNWLNDLSTGVAVPLPATSIIYTTGKVAGSSIANIVPASAPGATGYRFGASLTDLQAAATFLRKQNRWIEGQMYSLQPSMLNAQMFPADNLTTATYMQAATEEERRKGILMKAQGFGIMQRSTVVYVSAAGVIRAPGDPGDVGDSEAILCWYTQAVELAYGETKMFEQIGAPAYYGDLYSFLVRMGGRPRRADFFGICLLVQGTPTAAQITAWEAAIAAE